jgi:hypothetical protein
MLNKLEGHAFYIFTFTEEDYRNATPLVLGRVLWVLSGGVQRV